MTVAALLSLRVLLRSGELHNDEVNHLIIGKVDPNPGAIPDVLKSFLGEGVWASCKALESISVF